MKNQKDIFIENLNINHEYFLNMTNNEEIEKNIFFIIKFNLIFTTLCKIIIDNNKYFDNLWALLKEGNIKNKQENILIFSFGIGLVDYELYIKILDLMSIRNNNTITHPLNSFIQYDFENKFNEIDLILSEIKNKNLNHQEKETNIDIIKNILFFLKYVNDDNSIDILLASNNKNSKFRLLIDNMNKNNEHLINFFSTWLIENRKRDQTYKNICNIFYSLNEDTKKNIFKKILDFDYSFHSYETIELLYNNCNIDIFIKQNINVVINILMKWKNNQNLYYEYSEIRFILKSNILILIIDHWLTEIGNNNNLIDFYKWVIFNGNNYGITFSAPYFENIILKKSSSKALIKQFYSDNKELILKRFKRGQIREEMSDFLNKIK